MADSDQDTKLCHNCKKQISSNNFVMHEMHCKRHISLCEHCNEPIPKSEMEVHFEEVHAKINCPKCDVEVEKCHLEDHEENDCTKKPMQCLFCELEFPKDTLESHLDYCGSRTEPCPKCNQFIMLKDLTQHTDSGCTYPEAKPKNTNAANGYASMGFGQNVFDSVYAPIGIGAQGFRLEDVDMFGSGFQARGQEFTIPGIEMNARDIGPFRPKVTNQRSDNSGDKEISEYDRMLAMHLAQDLPRSDSLEDIIQFLDKPGSPALDDIPGQHRHNTYSADAVMIPCEFCGKPFDSEELVQHESGCSLDRISALLPQMNTANNERDVSRNSPVSAQPPSIINNLRNYGADEWLDDTAVTGYDIPTDMVRLPVTPPLESEDDLQFLPCEFCNELFPMDSLVQHQAMCDRMTMTPRPPTPPEEARPKPKQKKSISTVERLAADFPNLSSKRHQPPPTLFSTNSDSDDDSSPVGRSRPHFAHHVQKPKPTNRNGAFKTSVSTPAKESRSTLKKYGVETPDRGDYYTRQSSFPRQSSEEGAAEQRLNQNQATGPKRQIGSASRTRSTLNNLLSDTDETSSHDLLAHIGGLSSGRNSSNPLTRPKQALVADKGVPKPRPRANAKDVQQELSRLAASGSPAAAALSKNRSSGPGFEVRERPSVADEPSDIVTGTSSRPRARANGVFGAPSKPTVKRQVNKR